MSEVIPDVPDTFEDMDHYEEFMNALPPEALSALDRVVTVPDGGNAPGTPASEPPAAQPDAGTQHPSGTAAQNAPAADQQPAATPDDSEPAAKELPNNWRLNARGDAVKQQAFALLVQNPELSLSEAEARAKAALGITDNAEAAQAEAATGEATPPDDVLAELERQLDEAKRELEQAIQDFDADKEKELGQQVEELRFRIAEERAANRLHSERQAILEQQQFDQARQASNAEVQLLFGEHYKQGAPLFVEMGRVIDDLEKVQDPRLNEADAPMQVARIAALRLGWKPDSNGVPRPPEGGNATTAIYQQSSSQAVPQAGANAAPPIAPGSARTHAPAPPSLPDFDPEKMSVSDYEHFLQEKYGISVDF